MGGEDKNMQQEIFRKQNLCKETDTDQCKFYCKAPKGIKCI